MMMWNVLKRVVLHKTTSMAICYPNKNEKFPTESQKVSPGEFPNILDKLNVNLGWSRHKWARKSVLIPDQIKICIMLQLLH